MLHDGTAGPEYVKRGGGVAIVQAPTEAEYPSMPETALRNVDIDYVVPSAMMGSWLDEITRGTVPERRVDIPEDLKQEAAIAERVVETTEAVAALGSQVPSPAPTAAAASGN